MIQGSGTDLLQPREVGVLLLRARGFTLAEIGAVYGVGPERARQMLKAACAKVGANEPVHALAIVLHLGIVTIDELGGLDDDLGVIRISEHVRDAAAENLHVEP